MQPVIMVDEATSEVASPQRGSLLRRLLRNPLSLLGLVIVALLVVSALAAPFLAPRDPVRVDLTHRLLPPGPGHWMGTDDYGRDILSRILWGSRISLEICTVVVAAAALTGSFVGAVAGSVGGWGDEILMRVTDMFLAFPALVLAMVVAAVLGPSLGHTMAAIAVVWWPWYARLMRGEILRLRSLEFVEAARAVGASPWRVLLRHLFPNALGPVVVNATMDLGYVLLTAASLSFIGLGAQPPSPEWGAMITLGRQYVLSGQWWMITFPGLAIVVTVLGFNLIGDGLRDVLDPRLRG